MKVTKFEDIDFSKDDYWRVAVTPDVARKMLALNVDNNRQPKRRKEQYARDMKEGRWVTADGNTIKFNVNGKLFDGANRLRAVILSGATVNLDVKTGAPCAAMMTVDDVAVRSNGDAIKIVLNMTDQNNVAAISNVVQLLRNGAYNVGSHVGINTKPTRQEIVDFASLNRKQIREAIMLGRRASKSLAIRGMGIRYWFVCYWLTSLVNKEKADEFYEAVVNRDGIAVSFVEDAVLKDPETGRQKSPDWICYKYVRAFDLLMMNNSRNIGGTPENVAAAYKELWKEYVDNMRDTIDVGFTFIPKA
jgi:hypothetical protein